MGDQVWSRNPTTGAFDLADYRGLGAAPPGCNLLDLASLVGARVCGDAADRGSKPVALYPGAFRFSPVTGKPLPDPPDAHPDAWLPPFGGDGADGELPQGLRLTAVPLALRTSLSVEALPDSELAILPAGNYHFLVSACQTHEARLLALDFSRGLIYHWLPHSECWHEIDPGGEEMIAESSLGDDAWGMAAPDPEGSTRVFLPTDEGLAIVSINLIARTYESHTVGGCCVGAPALWDGKVYVPMLEEDGELGVYALEPYGTSLRRVEGPRLDAAAAEWIRPLADGLQLIWMAAQGQLVVQHGDGGTPGASFLAWPPGVTPRFDLGSPGLSAGGELWQQCHQEGRKGGAFVSVQLGRATPQIKAQKSARLGTGRASLPLEGSGSSADDEVVFPLLESTSASTLLCARVQGVRPVDGVFESSETFTTTFELRGKHDVQFWVARMPRPWATRPFVYAGHLYLYHPDKRRLQGWRIDG
jgi:hypothetical protein